MKTAAELEAFYQAELKAVLQPAEDRRKRLLTSILLGAAIGFAVGGGLGVFLASRGNLPVALVIAPLVSAVIGGSIAFSAGWGAFRRDYKASVISPIVSFFDPSFRYSPERGHSKAKFVASMLFSTRPDRFHSEDWVSGVVGATDFAFSEVKAEEKRTTRDSKGNTTTTYHTIFKGVWFDADFHKHFTGRTFVLPDGGGRLLGGFGSWIQRFSGGRGELVKLEDVEFERRFKVYSDCQVEARYILSPGLMRRILELRERFNRDLFITFQGDRVTIALPMSADLFEPRLFRSLLDYRLISETFGHLTLFIGIIEDLNLNTRLWSKTA